MLTEVAPPPRSTKATPFSISSSVRTALAMAPGVKYFRDMAISRSLKTLSMVLTELRLPMNSLKLPSKVSLMTPMISLSMSWKFSSSEYDCAMAPYICSLSGSSKGYCSRAILLRASTSSADMLSSGLFLVTLAQLISWRTSHLGRPTTTWSILMLSSDSASAITSFKGPAAFWGLNTALLRMPCEGFSR